MNPPVSIRPSHETPNGFWRRLVKFFEAIEMAEIDVLEMRIRRLEQEVMQLKAAPPDSAATPAGPPRFDSQP